MSEEYTFIIDTDQYAGNFEREMCAYCTGMVGDCGVGDKEAEKFLEEFGQEKTDDMIDIIGQKADEHGVYRPTEICITPDYLLSKQGTYQSVAIFLNKKPSQEIIKMLKERAEKFTEGRDNNGNIMKSKTKRLNILGFRMIKETTSSEEIEV